MSDEIKLYTIPDSQQFVTADEVRQIINQQFSVGNNVVLPTGSVFRNVQVGGATLQYQITNAGIINFGDGSDGAATFADLGTAPTGTTKTDNIAGATIFRLDRDVYYTTCTLNATVTINPNSYRIFCSTSATVNGTIPLNGNNGGTSSGMSAGFAGSAIGAGYLGISVAGGAGAAGNTTGQDGSAGAAGTAASNSLITTSGAAGGIGGEDSGGGGSGGSGAGGVTTASNVKLIANWHLATLLDVGTTGATAKFTTGASAGGGGSGSSGGPADDSGGGGGGASSAGIIAIYAKTLTIDAAGIIRANGGTGGNGGNGLGGAGGGGGGGGGNGGIIVLVYNTLSNSGTVTAALGTGGTAGTGGGVAATNGANGVAGTIYQFQVSL